MPALQESASRVKRAPFAFGTSRELTPAEEAERLRLAVETRRRRYAAHPCHACEIERAKAELALDDFLEAHPEVAA